MAVSQCPGRPARGPTSDQGKARTAGHRSARRTKHHLAKPRRRGTAARSRRTTRLQLHHNPAPRRDRSPALGPVRHQTLANDSLNPTSRVFASFTDVRERLLSPGLTPGDRRQSRQPAPGAASRQSPLQQIAFPRRTRAHLSASCRPEALTTWTIHRVRWSLRADDY